MHCRDEINFSVAITRYKLTKVIGHKKSLPWIFNKNYLKRFLLSRFCASTSATFFLRSFYLLNDFDGIPLIFIYHRYFQIFVTVLFCIIYDLFHKSSSWSTSSSFFPLYFSFDVLSTTNHFSLCVLSTFFSLLTLSTWHFIRPTAQYIFISNFIGPGNFQCSFPESCSGRFDFSLVRFERNVHISAP